MSDKPISVGDLVVVVKPIACCGVDKIVGTIFRVQKMGLFKARCSYCGHLAPSDLKTPWTPKGFKFGSIDSRRVKRIPPLDELEGVDTQEKLGEPA